MQSKSLFLKFFFVILFVAAVTCTAAAQSGQISDKDLQELLEKVETNFSGIQTLKTMMIQEKSIPVFTDKVISKGFCIFKTPDKLRLEFTEPFKSSLMVDGNKVMKYEFFDNTWNKIESGNQDILLMVMGNITSWLKGRFKDPTLYEIGAYKNDKIKIRLVPKAAEFKKFISSFEMGLNNKLDGLEYIIINENRNSVTKINFYNDIKNSQIPDSVFQGSENRPSAVSQW